MRNKNYYINLNDREYLDVLSSLMNKRNKLIQSGKYTDGIDEVIMKIKKAKKRTFRVLYSVNDSFLEDLDEDNISIIYRKVVANSVAFMMMERLGIDTEEYFEREDFEDIINFNTPGTLNALGFATSDIAEMGLTEIAKTVMSLERQNRIIAENRKPDYNTLTR